MHNVYLVPNPLLPPLSGNAIHAGQPETVQRDLVSDPVTASIKAVILPAGVRSRQAAAHSVFRVAWRQRPGNRLGFAA